MEEAGARYYVLGLLIYYTKKEKTHFRLWSAGNLMSFCILTLIISPGVPTMPPLNPATAANAKLLMKGMGSPLGLNVFLPTCKKGNSRHNF